MTDIQLFNFQEKLPVRVITLENIPWFVAMDVAQALKYADPSMMLKHVDTDDKKELNPHKLDNVKITETFSSNTFRVSLINESGLYAVIFGSTKEEAKKFKKWVTSDVLPSIRKTGKYESKPRTLAETLLAQAQVLVELEQKQLKQQEQIDSLEKLVHQHDSEIDRLFSPNGHYFSIMGYFASKGIPVSKEMAQRIGKSCTKYCKEENIPIQKLDDARYGKINAYPEEIIERFVDF
jgi:prophage antirepressor-like protein